MVHIGIDLHKRESQICWLDGETGELRHQRIQTRPDRFEAVLRSPSPAEVLIEASTESEWVAACVEGLGHRVHVVDPSYAPMSPGARRRRHKNDTRDAEALATASLRGTYRGIHRLSAVRREVRQVITVRESVVRTRTRLICVVRAALRSNGLRVPSGSPQRFAERVRQVPLSPALSEAIAPVLLLLEIVETQVQVLDTQVAAYIAQDRDMQRLQSAPHVGPITGAAFVAALDTPTRFRSATQVVSYLGLAPRDDSTGDRHRAGRISKAGSTRVRYLLVQASWGILTRPGPTDRPLHEWGQALAARRGPRVAVIGVARRLARILYAMWRDQRTFTAAGVVTDGQSAGAAAA